MTRRATWWARGVMLVWLTAVWILLWGSPSPADAVGGALVAVALIVAFPLQARPDDALRFRPLPALGYGLWFLKALVVSSLTVARDALVPRSISHIRPAIVAVPLRTRSDRLATIVANTITLTPGTMTVEARGCPATLYVHVLAFTDAPAALAEVAAIERRVVRAFGSPEEVRAIVTGERPDGAREPAHRREEGAP